MSRPAPVALASRQIAWEQLSFWRNLPAAVFTVLLPLVFLLVLATVFRSSTVQVSGRTVPSDDHLIPALAAFGVMGACFTNIAMTTSIRRDRGLLKRLRGTPMPPWVFMCGLIGSSALVSLVLVTVTTAAGTLLFGVGLPRHPLALATALTLGAMCFCALGLAMSAAIPNADAAPAVVNAIFLPVVFISNIFFVVPAGSPLATIAGVFPVRHLAAAMVDAFDPANVGGQGFAGADLAVLALWGLAGLAVALRWFHWEPRRR